LYALGKLVQGPAGLAIGEAGTFSSLMLSTKGREGALGTAVKNAKIGMIIGAVLGGGGVIATVLGFVLAPSASEKPVTSNSAKPATPTHATTPAHSATAAHTAAATAAPSAKKPH